MDKKYRSKIKKLLFLGLPPFRKTTCAAHEGASGLAETDLNNKRRGLYEFFVRFYFYKLNLSFVFLFPS
ncbi:hypothetical protein, partial [Bacillus paranthracis]|uniref:hypothetical protein n=1 Tax=Bacillus paranthracis TaxID=2026186 RepID=UPI002D78F793